MEAAGRLRCLAARVLRLAERFFAIVGLALVAWHCCLSASVMVSASMSPALQGTAVENGDWVVSERVSYWLRAPRRWEIVRFHTPEGIEVMKRVVGRPGESVSIQEGRVSIDGREVARPEALAGLYYYAYGNVHNGGEVACGKGYYLLGDDSRDSQDSRFEGPLDEKRIQGRAWLIVWPLERMGFVQ